MLRGDDVVDLQHAYALGFDAGREDGIFGPHTSRALQEFQRNAGLAPDGIGGPEAIAALLRLGAMSAGSVAEVREREMLRDPRSLRGMRIYLATGPELHGLGDALVRRLIDAGAEAILDPSGADDAELAAAANDLRADLFLSLRLGPVRDAVHLLRVARFHSEGGRRVASGIAAALTRWLPTEPEPWDAPTACCARAHGGRGVRARGRCRRRRARRAHGERGRHRACSGAGIRSGVESDYDPPVISR